MHLPADPIAQFSEWLQAAEQAAEDEPAAMTLATVDANGQPSARLVLLRGYDARGFVFYTNLESRKGDALRANPLAALCFHWKSVGRQVRVEGTTEPVGEAQADAYFAGRPRDAQIGAWASSQSRELPSRFELEKRIALYAVRFGFSPVPRPPFWSGYRVVPAQIEFWEERPFRLHDRTLFVRAGAGWERRKLYP